MNDLISKAEQYAAQYDADDRQDVKADIMNAFFAGAAAEREVCLKISEEIKNVTVVGGSSDYHVGRAMAATVIGNCILARRLNTSVKRSV